MFILRGKAGWKTKRREDTGEEDEASLGCFHLLKEISNYWSWGNDEYSKFEVQSTPINRLLSLWGSTFTFSNHQGLFSKWSLVTWKSWLASQTEQLSPSRPGESQSTWGMRQCVYTHARSPSSVHMCTHIPAPVHEAEPTGSPNTTIPHCWPNHIWCVPLH